MGDIGIIYLEHKRAKKGRPATATQLLRIAKGRADEEKQTLEDAQRGCFNLNLNKG